MRRFVVMQGILLMCAGTMGMAAPFSREAKSSVSDTRDGDVYRTVVNSTFNFFWRSDAGQPSEVLLSQTVTSKFISGREGQDSYLEATAWVTRSKPYDTKLWTIETAADEGGKWGDYYRTVTHGCCGDEDTYETFDITTGRYLFAYTAGPLFIEAPTASIKQTVSYISPSASSHYEWAKAYPDAGGVLTLYAGDKIIDRVIVDSQEEQLRFSPTLTLISEQEPKGTQRLELFDSNGGHDAKAVIDGFSVKLSFDSGTVMILPVRADRFDIKKAVLPKWASVKRIPVPTSPRRSD